MNMMISVRWKTSIHSTSITMSVSIRGGMRVHIKINISIYNYRHFFY